MTRERAVQAAVVAALAACLTNSCAPSRIRLPSGTGVAASDAEHAFDEATAACRNISTLSAEVAVDGSIGGRHIPRTHLILGVSSPASARIEATAPFGGPVFVLAARDNDATLLLLRDNRVLAHGAPEAVLEALAGVPLGPADLRTTLTGCPVGPTSSEARQVDEDWRMFLDGTGTLYLHRDSHAGPWRLVASARHSPTVATWLAEYHDFKNGLPQTVQLASTDPSQFDLRLRLSQVEINAPLEAGVFSVQTPPSAAPITLDELRRSGPLRGR
jgi:hypothetical protein